MRYQRFHWGFLVRAAPFHLTLPLLMCTCDSYTSAMQTIALFGLKMNRFPATVGAALFFILYVSYVTCLFHAWRKYQSRACIGIVPVRITWTRSRAFTFRRMHLNWHCIDLINFLAYQVFLLYVHYMRENVRLSDFILHRFLNSRIATVGRTTSVFTERSAQSSVQGYTTGPG